MKIEHPHSFSREEATARLRALTRYWEKYGVDTSWTDERASFSGKVKGIKFSGSMTIEDSRIVADVRVGFLAEKIGGRSYVDRKVKEYLDASNSLEQLEARA